MQAAIFELLDEVKEELPEQDVESIVECLTHNEWGIAFETLCIQVDEYQIPISREFYEKASCWGNLIDTRPSYWLPL